MIENPLGSAAWRQPALRRLRADSHCRQVLVDMCRFNLRHQPSGEWHKKPTRLLTSSQAVVSKFLGKRCTGGHVHAPVMGGSKITTAAGHYTKSFANGLVEAFEDEFNFETLCQHQALVTHECYEVVGGHGGLDYVHEVLAEDGLGENSESDDDLGEKYLGEITPAVRAAVRRVHEATGHRSARRLARALLISGAPPEAVQAARELRCDVCDERKNPKARRVGSLPPPRAVGEQLHADLVMVEDAAGNVYVVAHATDAVSRYQLAAVIPDRSSSSVIDFLSQMWLPLLGAPRQVIADQGREFISEEFQTWCSSHSIILWHAAVQAPWQNGICERSGGILKSIVAAIVADHAVLGERDMKNAVSEACAAYNADPNVEGMTPLQCVTGRQPSSQGSVLTQFAGRLAEHGLIDTDPGLMQRLALRESARVAMVRLHYSQAIRKAELARSREPTTSSLPSPGDVVFFWRAQRLNRRGDPRLSTSSRRRRLELRRWHGPAILIALEGDGQEGIPRNAFLSFRGQVTKCALEHVRPASTIEQLAAGTWEDAIRELIADVKDTAPPESGVAAGPESIPEGDAPQEQNDEIVVNVAPPSLDSATAPTPSPPSTAAPGTPVASLFQRPALQQALSRSRQQPLALQLQQQALSRGQPSDFQNELRAAMERGIKRRASSDLSSEPGLQSRQPSSQALEPPGSVRRVEAPPTPTTQTAAAPAFGSEPLPSAPSDVRPVGDLAEEVEPRPAFESFVLTREQLANISHPTTTSAG